MSGLVPERPEMLNTVDIMIWNGLERSLEDDNVEWGSKVWNWLQMLDKHKLSALRGTTCAEFDRRRSEDYNPPQPGYRTLDGFGVEEPA